MSKPLCSADQTRVGLSIWIKKETYEWIRKTAWHRSSNGRIEELLDGWADLERKANKLNKEYKKLGREVWANPMEAKV